MVKSVAMHVTSPKSTDATARGGGSGVGVPGTSFCVNLVGEDLVAKIYGKPFNVVNATPWSFTSPVTGTKVRFVITGSRKDAQDRIHVHGLVVADA